MFSPELPVLRSISEVLLRGVVALESIAETQRKAHNYQTRNAHPSWQVPDKLAGEE